MLSMTPGELQSLFANLKVWHAQGWRAPNKPLLALWAIGRCLRNEARLAPYEEIARELGGLLRRFGPPRKRVNPDLPFWHLQRDGVWEVPEADRITQTLSGHAHIASLRREGAHGGLPTDVFLALRQDRVTALDIVYSLLDAHFPDTLHDEVLRAVGIKAGYAKTIWRDFHVGERQRTGQEFEQVWRRQRDPAFSDAVLDAYGERCAVCAFSVRLHGATLALDAAHIKWHRAGGRNRDKVNNGLSLCALHHRLFDAGAFTLSPKYTVITAPAAVGNGRDHSLEQFSRCPILLPKKTEDYPDCKSLRWHHREVFGPVIEGIDY